MKGEMLPSSDVIGFFKTCPPPILFLLATHATLSAGGERESEREGGGQTGAPCYYQHGHHVCTPSEAVSEA